MVTIITANINLIAGKNKAQICRPKQQRIRNADEEKQFLEGSTNFFNNWPTLKIIRK
jgi:hypothetical protein